MGVDLKTICLPLGFLQGGREVRAWYDFEQIPLFRLMVKLRQRSI